ncbi:beta-ketoacyl synthase N-terminal-like domain-containing protein [Streptomyces chumphonensis]|uniref:beta-ketoacyl synthase N-terminal-like domain-containing protein n=1 Tax=Streptomyces chumphonensis TaxID=1214925 RepID=UPI003D73BFA2
MTALDATRVAVTGVGVVSPRGFDGSAAGRERTASPEGWFDHRTHLGRRGYKYLPTAAQYFLAASNRALEAGGGLDHAPPESRGAAVGTNSAAEALHAAMDTTITTSSATDLSPATAPFFSINLFGSRMAMEHGLQGFNLTLTSPRVAGLEAIQTGLRSVRLGRADWLLAGATEEALAPLDPAVRDSEAGAVALVLEPAREAAARGSDVLGHLVVRSGYLPPGTPAPEARERAGRILGEGPGGLALRDATVVAVVDDSPVSEAVVGALGTDVRRVPAGAGSLEPLLQIAGLLGSGAEGPTAVVTAAAQGNVALCWVIPPDRTDAAPAATPRDEA